MSVREIFYYESDLKAIRDRTGFKRYVDGAGNPGRANLR